jgi:hypothetical protein
MAKRKVSRRAAVAGLAGASLAPKLALAKHVGTAASQQAIVPLPVPVAITLSPPSPVAVLDTAHNADAVATVGVVMADSSTFTGTLGFAAPNFDAGGLVNIPSGNTIRLTRNLTTADDGNHLITVSATQNSQTIGAAEGGNLTMTVQPPSGEAATFVTAAFPAEPSRVSTAGR